MGRRFTRLLNYLFLSLPLPEQNEKWIKREKSVISSWRIQKKEASEGFVKKFAFGS